MDSMTGNLIAQLPGLWRGKSEFGAQNNNKGVLYK